MDSAEGRLRGSAPRANGARTDAEARGPAGLVGLWLNVPRCSVGSGRQFGLGGAVWPAARAVPRGVVPAGGAARGGSVLDGGMVGNGGSGSGTIGTIGSGAGASGEAGRLSRPVRSRAGSRWA